MASTSSGPSSETRRPGWHRAASCSRRSPRPRPERRPTPFGRHIWTWTSSTTMISKPESFGEPSGRTRPERGVGLSLAGRVARARLAGQVIRRLRRAGLTDVRYDARSFQVRFTAGGDEESTIIELGPLLATAGKKRREQVGRFVAGLLLAPGLPQDWFQVQPLLRPVLRGGTPGAHLRRPVLPFLSEFVVVDQPDTMTYVAAAQLAAWGVRAETVFAAARANLSGAVLQGVAHEPVVVQFVDDGDAYWT